MKQGIYFRIGKRALDLVLALFGLIILSPLLFFASLCVALTSNGPVFFCQVRTGRFGKPFRIFKFRTMLWEPEAPGSVVTAAGDPRITAIGKVLRKTKIDELPQLF